jgi:hypothetical protein
MVFVNPYGILRCYINHKYQNDQVKKDEIGRAHSTHGKKDECIHVLVRNLEAKR